MPIKFNGSTVDYIKYNSTTANVKRVKYNGTQIWVKPYTLNVNIKFFPATISSSVLKSYSIEVTSRESGTGGSIGKVIDGSTIYEGDALRLSSISLEDGYSYNAEGFGTVNGSASSSTYDVTITVVSSTEAITS